MNQPTTAELPRPRLWRSPAGDFHGDELLSLASAYTPATLENIRSNGFDSIWARGRLR